MSRTNTTPILTVSSVSAYNVLKSFQKHWSGTASASNFTKAHDVKVCWIQFPCYGAAVPSIKVVRHFKVPTGTCFNIRLIQLLWFFHHRNAVVSKIVLCFCWVSSNLRSRMSQKTVGVLTFALRHLHWRAWDCTYSLRLCRAWAPEASGAVPWAAPGIFYFSPLFLGGRFTQRPAPGHWQQDFRPVQELAFTEGSRGEESNSGRTSAEQTRLRAAPSPAVSARPWSPSSPRDRASPHSMMEYCKTIGFPTAFSS